MALDDKLREILYNLRDSKASNARIMPDTLAQIKQAFADEGYINLKTTTVNGERWMSGQEWYDRFTKELLKDTPVTIEDWEYSGGNIIEAAKKASGIE